MIELENGSVAMTRRQFGDLLNYSSSLPTGTTPGKRWRRAVDWYAQDPGDEWVMGEFGEPYPEGHEHHGSTPIYWRPIVILGWPRRASFYVPPPLMRGRSAPAPQGEDEGALCLRTYGDETCFGSMVLAEDPAAGSCTCHLGHPPCGWCVSTMPTCDQCGHRIEE